MTRVLVIHGAGMDMRGKVQTATFGTMTLPQYDARIREYAAELGMDIETFHSNVEGEVISKLYAANDLAIEAALINPADFSYGYPALLAAISRVNFPTFEIHISNPISRGVVSEVSRVCQATVTGFGIAGYYLALFGIREHLKAKAR